METETKQRYSETKRSYETNGSNRYLQIFYPKTKGYTFFSALHGIFSKTDHMVTKQASTDTKILKLSRASFKINMY
jgi:deoxyadenosine/deoxycytidine kinase